MDSERPPTMRKVTQPVDPVYELDDAPVLKDMYGNDFRPSRVEIHLVDGGLTGVKVSGPQVKTGRVGTRFYATVGGPEGMPDWLAGLVTSALRAETPPPPAGDLAVLYSALDSARSTMCFSSQDWGVAPDFAWLYGILVGWSDDPSGGDVDQVDALGMLAARFGWSGQEVDRLRQIRAAVAGFDLNRVAELEATISRAAELRAVFEKQWLRVGKATDRWRAEDPHARALVSPDLGNLVQWLMDQADRGRPYRPNPGFHDWDPTPIPDIAVGRTVQESRCRYVYDGGGVCGQGKGAYDHTIEHLGVGGRQLPNGYDAGPYFSGEEAEVWERWARYAIGLDRVVPGWHEHDETKMAPGLAAEAFVRRRTPGQHTV